MATWIEGNNGNRASIERWGSEKSARKSLERLIDCYDCSGCSGCSGCYGCSGCSGCYGCYGCSGCSDCYGCYDMSPQKAEMKIPVIADIHKKIYEAVSQPKALDMRAFHICETTHCRACWAIHLAGKEGYDLEAKTSSVFAAMQIYKASGYLINPCRFFDSNADALADMKKLAENPQ